MRRRKASQAAEGGAPDKLGVCLVKMPRRYQERWPGELSAVHDRLITMNKHHTHQIDDLAQRFLRDALPPTWVPNEQHKDYGKDYLVEIGEDNGDLTGSSFFIQLKGQEKADLSVAKSVVKYRLESKYARYYFDKIKDLPVFLVVVDVNQKKGWWLFLQPVLEADQTWGKQDSITLSLPSTNDITDTARLRKAVEEAKKWMRLHHPESIHESVVAHKQRITDTDPRFDVNVSLVNDQPMFTLLPKEEVPLTFSFTGDREEIGKKVSDLIDKGALVAFQPGEVKVTGSKLFEPIEQGGCVIQAAVMLPGTLTLICRDAEGKELARLSDVPGKLTGGRKELWFDGSFANSPLTIKLGPIAPAVGGSVKLNLNLRRWDGQRLMQLAYFDRLEQFFHALPTSVVTSVECQHHGNVLFSLTLPLQKLPFAIPLADFLEMVRKARKIAERFTVNPVWTVEGFDRDTLESVDQLHAIFYGSGWRQPMPHVRLTANCIRKTFRFDVAKQAKAARFWRLTSPCAYPFFGEKVEVGKLVHDYTEMSVMVMDDSMTSASRKRKKGRGKRRRAAKPSSKRTVKIALIGSKATVWTVRTEDQVPPEQAQLPVLSSRSKVEAPAPS
jgi:hypothetical protein